MSDDLHIKNTPLRFTSPRNEQNKRFAISQALQVIKVPSLQSMACVNWITFAPNLLNIRSVLGVANTTNIYGCGSQSETDNNQNNLECFCHNL